MSLKEATPEFIDGLKGALGPKGWRDPVDAPEAFKEDHARLHDHRVVRRVHVADAVHPAEAHGDWRRFLLRQVAA
ncbi:MAG: hypothetical protein AAFU55_07235, partial [Pseudomonadota bacterium]